MQKSNSLKEIYLTSEALAKDAQKFAEEVAKHNPGIETPIKKTSRLRDYYNAFVAEPVTEFGCGLGRTSLQLANFIDPKRKAIRNRMLEEIDNYREAQQSEAVNRLGRGRSKITEYPAWWLREISGIGGSVLPSYAGVQGLGGAAVRLANRVALGRGALSAKTYSALRDLPHIPRPIVPVLTYGDELAIGAVALSRKTLQRKRKKKQRKTPRKPLIGLTAGLRKCGRY